jgi:hypothetical protein
MAELVEFTESTLPRPEPFVRHYVRRIEPWYGFVIYGVLWWFVAFTAFAIGVLPGFLLAGALGIAKTSLLAKVVGIGGGVLAFGAAWIPFVRWCKRRRARVAPLVRDGTLYDGRVFDRMSGSGGQVAKRVAADFAMSQIGAKYYRVAFERAGMQHMLQVPAPSGTPSPGTPLPVLFHPSSPYAFVFDGGKAHVAKVSA